MLTMIVAVNSWKVVSYTQSDIIAKSYCASVFSLSLAGLLVARAARDLLPTAFFENFSAGREYAFIPASCLLGCEWGGKILFLREAGVLLLFCETTSSCDCSTSVSTDIFALSTPMSYSSFSLLSMNLLLSFSVGSL